MDKHSKLLTTFVKRTIFTNLEKINDYYKQVELGHETYTQSTSRLIKYLESNNNIYIDVYIKEFGRFWIY